VKFRIAAIPSDTNYALQWALPAMDWDTAYTTIPVTGSATLAVLDTGIDATHPDLAGRMGTGQSFTASVPTVDTNGHGTALAGIAAADVNNGLGIAGVAYSPVQILPVQVLQTDGTGWDADVVAGVLWAADNNADVILMGFSSTEYSAALADAVAYAESKGVVIVAASGNDGTSTATYPAGMSGVIGVAATDNTNTIATFSNTGSASVAAPGVAILATKTGGTYAVSSGTSAAAAEVAGLATLLSANGKSAAEISTQIKGTTDPVTGSSIGQVNVLNALSGVAVVTPVITPVVTVTPGVNVTYVVGDTVSITSVTPNSGPTLGNTLVTISGSFPNGQRPFTVTFGGIAAIDVTWVNKDTLTAKTPAHADGSVNVVVIDKNGGASGTATLTGGFTYGVTNQPPTISSNNALVTVNEGQTASNTGTWSDANSGDTIALSASPGTIIKGGTNAAGTWSWSFATTDGPIQSQTVTITANDGNGGVTTTTFTLTVNNVAPSGTFNAPTSVNEGSPIDVSITSVTDPSSADTVIGFTYAFKTGSTPITGSDTFSATSTASFPTTDNGPVTVRGAVKDKDGGIREYTAIVSVSNVAPSGTFNAPTSVNEGSPIDVSMTSVTDPSSADTSTGFTYAFKTGSTPITGSDTFSATSTASFPTTDNGPVTVRGAIKDKDGGIREYTATVTVANVAPTATFGNTGPVNEGSPFTLSLTIPVDVAADVPTLTYAFDCGDGSGYGTAGAAITANCPTTDNGIRSVKGKIMDKDGGVSEYTAQVTVNNVAPTVSISGASTVNEGVLYTLTLSATGDPGADIIDHWDITWGDGNNEAVSGNPISATHTYADGPSSPTISASVTDEDGTYNAPSDVAVTVANVAPTATFGNTGPVNEGSPFTLSLTIPVDVAADVPTLTYAFDCGDGSGYGTAGAAITANCPTTDNGIRSVKGKIMDKDGGVSEYTAQVTVNNVAPTVSISGASTVNEGVLYTLTLSATGDPGADIIDHWDITWGDGNNEAVSGNPISATHTYADGPSSPTISASVTDEDGTYNAPSDVAVTVANVAPTLIISGAAAVNEGATYTLSLSSSDPGVDTIAHWDITWGDGSLVQEVSGNPSSVTHVYADGPASPTISATATDEDGTYASNTKAVTVNNVAPTLTISGAAAVNEGATYTLSLSSSDPGADTIAHWDITWGDGSLVQEVSGNPSSVTHVYADGPASPTISATATDEDGTYASNTKAVTVNNIAPVVVANPSTQSVQYSDPIASVTITATDVAADIPLSASTTWRKDGGSPNTGLPTGLSFSAPSCGLTSCTWTLSGIANVAPGSYVIQVTANDDVGSGFADITIIVTQENARATYTGVPMAFTSSATSSSATVVLAATIQDITAVSGDPAYDPNAGDIRNAKVTFTVDGNPVCSNLPVGLVTSDTKTGTATCNWNANIGNSDGVSYTIGIIVNNYYTRNSADDNVVVQVSKPIGTNFITGGGYLVLTNSAGKIAGDAGKKNNFGFNVKYNKAGTNLQGNINTIIRRTESDGKVHVYQVKGNAMTSLVAQPQPNPSSAKLSTAIFTGKANIRDITDPLLPVSIDGGATLKVTMSDSGEPGSSDTIGITVLNKDGGTWYTSNWDGITTKEQLLGGGNLVVH
jgi:hypothetical protein